MKKSLAVVALCLAIEGCAGFTSTGMPQAVVVSNLKDNAYFTRVDNSVAVKKTGKACTKNILGVYAWGDSSLDAAMNNGGISKVAFYGREYFNVLGVYSRGCTVANGN